MSREDASARRRRPWAGRERDEQRALLEAGDPVLLLRAVIAEGVERHLWRGSGQFARDILIRDERTVRRWLADNGDSVEIPAAVRERLVTLALDMGLGPADLLEARDGER